VGSFCTTKSEFAIALGYDCDAGGSTDSRGSHAQIALGHNADAHGPDAVSIGRHNLSDAFYGSVYGTYLDNNVAGEYATLIGYGIPGSPHTKLTNTVVGAFKIGLNSDVPTFIMTAAVGGTGDLSNAGIGVVPVNRLDVNGGVTIGGPSWAGSTSAGDGELWLEKRLVIVQEDGSMYGPHELEVTGSAWCSGGVWATSDATYKKDITLSQLGLSEIRKIDVINYRFIKPSIHDDGRLFTGVLAQDLEEIIPTAVRTDTVIHKVIKSAPYTESVQINTGDPATSYTQVVYHPAVFDSSFSTRKSVKADEVMYVMVNAVKELAATNDTLRQSNARLQSETDSLRRKIDAVEMELLDVKIAVSEILTRMKLGADAGLEHIRLEQNQPNPFTDYTDIVYEIDASLQGDFYLDVSHVATSTMKVRIPAVAGSEQTEHIVTSGWERGAYIYCIRSTRGLVLCKSMMLN